METIENGFEYMMEYQHPGLSATEDCWLQRKSADSTVMDRKKAVVEVVEEPAILSDAKKLLYGVPQGSVLGPILFPLYTTPLSKVIQNHPGISFQFNADDTQLYVHLAHKNAASALDKLSRCLEDVKRWLSTNKLKLNPDKTEFIVFGSKSQREKLNHSFPVNILGNLIYHQ